jgi:polyhydroxyalkanoate synthase subunit PhaC
MQLAATPRDTVFRDGTAQLYRFRSEGVEPVDAPPVLLIPSIINRWYVLDLRPGASLAEALVAAGHRVYCLDWGAPEDEDRYLSWEDLIDRLARMSRKVRKLEGVARVSLLGYCIGGTLSGIYSALHHEDIAGFVNLAGPFDFREGGFLAHMTDARWFDPAAIASAGNMGATQMQAGFAALRPTSQIAKWVNFLDKAHLPAAREAFEALETWAGDNIAFPAAAYETYIRELYQENRLVQGTHRIRGEKVDLGKIDCPVMTIVTERDTICPPRAAQGLNDRCSAKVKDVVTVPGGHVGAVIGSRASKVLYPAIAKWLQEKPLN